MLNKKCPKERFFSPHSMCCSMCTHLNKARLAVVWVYPRFTPGFPWCFPACTSGFVFGAYLELRPSCPHEISLAADLARRQSHTHRSRVLGAGRISSMRVASLFSGCGGLDLGLHQVSQLYLPLAACVCRALALICTWLPDSSAPGG